MGRLALSGLDGGSALAWMAAVGTLRVLDEAIPGLRLCWTHQGAWLPVLQASQALEEEGILDELVALLEGEADRRWAFSDKANVQKHAPEEWQALLAGHCHDPQLGHWLPALCGEAQGKDLAPAMTAWMTLTGAGRQDFFITCRNLAKRTQRPHLQRALFGTWDYGDAKLSLRWDADERLHAYRAEDPSDIPGATMWGANRLALEALALFPTVPGTGTTGWARKRLRLPIWSPPITVRGVKSLVAQAWDEPQRLRQRGITTVFEFERHDGEKGRRTIRYGRAV